ncbi:ras-related protein rabf2b [Anaeramoeba flamelloides]|uniref:Ras-related protein rabf2b n=1 Tax=Anaeramoeba flamelloides TaxID=1746091 RepID=A0ABQ8Z689_9EUKA|nr:ras-related protein rabf2b [Anaeramoeba flamelloides]
MTSKFLTEVQQKVVVLGDFSVGKSSLILRVSKNEFLEEQESTIGAAFINFSVNVDNKPNQIQIWDTAGQEKFRSLTPIYYRGAIGAIVVYDVSREYSFQTAKEWVEELKEKANPKLIIALCANKIDLLEEKKKLLKEKEYADENGLLIYETSAKTGKGVTEMFVDFSKNLPKDQGREIFNDDFFEEEFFNIELHNGEKKTEKTICC